MTQKHHGDLTGSLLLAHPLLRDPNFRHAIIFLFHHEPAEGATGFILNQPTGQTTSHVHGLGDLPDVPVFSGGPVESSNVLLASLLWREKPAGVAFRMFTEWPGEPGNETGWLGGLRVFEGYAGWSAGQLEREISEQSWIVVPPARELILSDASPDAWRTAIRQGGPLLQLLADAPDKPEWN